VLTSNAAQKYRHTQIHTANPGRLVLMMYDGLVSRLRRAESALNRDEAAPTDEHIAAATAIVTELAASLNREAGREVAANLAMLYVYMQKRLAEARRTRETTAIAELADLAEGLRSAWAEMLAQQAGVRFMGGGA